MANNDKSSGMAVMLGAAQIKERFAKGSDEVKALLKDLFGEKLFTRPTLDDHTTIKTYEDACEALGIEPVDFVNLAVPDHIKALMKLDTISRALWGKSWEPKPQAEWDGNTYFWFPWFCLYTKEEVAQIKSNPEDYDCAALFGGGAFWCGCWVRLSVYEEPSYGYVCVPWVPLVPGIKRKGTVLCEHVCGALG